MPQKRWAAFISGRGSNLARLLDSLGEDVRLVITTDIECQGVYRARRRGAHVILAPRGTDKKIDWDELEVTLQRFKITSIFLLGFMRIVPRSFLESSERLCLNLHPSLLPQYPGLNSIQRAFDDRSDVGATIHSVVPEVDAGPIVSRALTVGAAQLKAAVAGASSEDTFKACEFLVHVDEQRLVERSSQRFDQRLDQRFGQNLELPGCA